LNVITEPPESRTRHRLDVMPQANAPMKMSPR
jgi:hypothetical protein